MLNRRMFLKILGVAPVATPVIAQTAQTFVERPLIGDAYMRFERTTYQMLIEKLSKLQAVHLTSQMPARFPYQYVFTVDQLWLRTVMVETSYVKVLQYDVPSSFPFLASFIVRNDTRSVFKSKDCPGSYDDALQLVPPALRYDDLPHRSTLEFLNDLKKRV